MFPAKLIKKYYYFLTIKQALLNNMINLEDIHYHDLRL